MTTAKPSPTEPIGWHIYLYLALLAILPFFALKFGVGNQIEQFSIVQRLLDPAFAENDFFIDSAALPGQPRYYFCLMLATLAQFAPLELVVHTLMVGSGFTLGLATFVACRRLLGASDIGAAMAATLVLLNYGISIGFAGYLAFTNFQPASLAIAAGIAGITLLALGQIWRATALSVFATAMHPTLGAEVFVLGIFAVVGGQFLAGERPRLLPLAGSAAIFFASLAALWVLPNIGNGGERLTDAEFFAILIEFRAPHHYLGLDFPKRRWLEAILFVTSAYWILLVAWRAGVPRAALAALGLMIAAVVGLCVLSLYFVDIAESRIWSTAQLFRMVLLLKWAGYVLVGWMIGHWLQKVRISDLVLVAVIVLPSADAFAYALPAALATRAVISRLGLGGWVALVATLPACLVAVDHHRDYGADEQLLRLAVACAAFLCLQFRARAIGAVAATALVAAFLTVSILGTGKGPFAQFRFQTALSIADRADDGAAIAAMARELSADGAVWLVPPELEQFRFISGRAVVVDFTSIPFTDTGLREWHNRMQTVFGSAQGSGFGALREMTERYRENPAPAAAVAAQNYGAQFAVLYSTSPWEGEVLASAGGLKAVRITP